MRLLVTGMYLLLSVGAISMVYPFALMFSTATTDLADCEAFRLVPEYWHNDLALFRKYLLDAADVEELAVWFGRDDWHERRDMKPEHLRSLAGTSPAERQRIADAWGRFLGERCPDEFKLASFKAGGSDSALALRTEYLTWLEAKYATVEAANRAYLDNALTWQEFNVPVEPLHRRPGPARRMREWRQFITSRAPQRTGLFHADRSVLQFLRAAYGNCAQLAAQTGFRAGRLTDVTFEQVQAGDLGDEAKREYYRQHAPLRYVRVDPSAGSAWQAFLGERGKIETLPLSSRMPEEPGLAALWAQFAQKGCPLEALDLARPDEGWTLDVPLARATSIAHYDAFLQSRAALRLRYLTHNFVTVLRFICVHGQALWVTVVFIVLAVGTALTVNPLAAYALSRFRLRETHYVLVFLLATMAFPGEVLMIPSFLLIKSFPLAQFGLAAVCLLGFLGLSRRLGRGLPRILGAIVALVVTAVLAGYVLPRGAALFNWRLSASLLNTFWALVLPGLANGFAIFLLKGFFDSLPPELYEAGLIDGAGELRMFWQITLPLCKPILAVMALGAFTAAYGAFMHAFLVCQDPRMWTLMVFLYEFQQSHTVPMAMASLVIAAVPTLIVFVLCQRVILRGIVIPTFK